MWIPYLICLLVEKHPIPRHIAWEGWNNNRIGNPLGTDFLLATSKSRLGNGVVGYSQEHCRNCASNLLGVVPLIRCTNNVNLDGGFVDGVPGKRLATCTLDEDERIHRFLWANRSDPSRRNKSSDFRTCSEVLDYCKQSDRFEVTNNEKEELA